MSEFKKGDTVMLKSGGPIMTIEHLGNYSYSGGPEDGAKCVWFEGAKPQDKVFDSAVLMKYEA